MFKRQIHYLMVKLQALSKSDDGISLLWVAVVFLFLTASAALAIDVSGAFNNARTDQNTADLACLAGAAELPDQTSAINTAVAYIDANWPAMASATLTLSLPTATYDAANGNSVYLDSNYGGDDDAMYLRVTEVVENSFGRTIGQDTITVVQEAACSGQTIRTGTGMLPIGALPGLWNGDLFDCAAKVTGNCGALSPQGGGSNAYRDAVANGIQGNFVKHHGNKNTPDPDTGLITITCMANPCSVTNTEPGNMVGPWNQGLAIRFSNTAGADCIEAGTFNCDAITDVFPGITTLAASGIPQPAWWQVSLYGDFALAKAATNPPNAQHWYFNGSGMKCDSVRMATVPIVNSDLNWNLGGAKGTWPNGKKDMKMIGFYTVYIREPNTIAEIGGPMEADVVWFGPDAECETGEKFQPFGSTQVIDTGVKLVAP